MATEAPDPRTFKTSDDAFQYPIPVVRKLEQQLRSHADENREKLRSLVGASYRSLLDTAETIIDMEVGMERVESKLAKVGRDCNTRKLERIVGNAGGMDVSVRDRDLERYTFASQLGVLRSCPAVMTRLLKSEGSYLLVAKVLIISRLLHKALSQSKSKPPILDQLWERLLSVRRKLLRRIDKRLGNASTSDISPLVESMCAYALATSSTPTDVLQHFHKIRLEKIAGLLKNGHEELAKHGTAALKLCIQTCQDTQTIFPRRLADSLAKLKTHPLVQDAEVRALYELNLDIHDRWIGDEARNYTPWPRHDELQRQDAERILHQWSKTAISAFLKGTKVALENEDRLKEVASLRSELIETWILSGSRMAGVKSANVLDDLRDTMNTHLETIVQKRTRNLKTVVTGISSILGSWPEDTNPPKLSLWNTVSHSTDLSNGAASFKSKILNTHQGRDESVINIVSTFDAWMDSVLEVKSIVKSMKEARWDDTFADDVSDTDSDSLEESKQTLLSSDDPRLLEEVTQEALTSALQNLGKTFTTIVTRLTEDEDDENVHQISFILRTMREINQRITSLRLNDKATPLSSPFTTTLSEPLHTALAKHVVQAPTKAYKRSLSRSLKLKSKCHILWEGHPPLPAQPSPSVFGYLQALTRAMAGCGSDLWAPAGVMVLRRVAVGEVGKILEDNLESIDKLRVTKPQEEKDGEETSSPPGEPPTEDDSEEVKSHKFTQTLFDILYLERFIGNDAAATTDSSALVSVIKTAVGKSGLDEAGVERLRKAAREYAKKTYLVFGMLMLG